MDRTRMSKNSYGVVNKASLKNELTENMLGNRWGSSGVDTIGAGNEGCGEVVDNFQYWDDTIGDIAVLKLPVNHNLFRLSSRFAKRAIDIVGSTIGLIVLSPIFFALGVLIRLDSPGPLTYLNICTGRGGRSFGVIKFRTMYMNSDQILKEILEKDAVLRQEWDQYHKLKIDPRITRVGRFLRKYSLDELPQLWNVLMGEMSMVGPRPMQDWEAKIYGPTLGYYLKARPGLTGLWQVSGRNQTTFARRAQLDYEYIQRWSIWTDIHILLRTIWVVISCDGAC
jgi:Undecaprenyl-phosphate galactose phosphotransferase WbaP